jgi:hypothetical protein
MFGKNLLEGRTGPVSQSIDAVKALLSWRGRGTDPMPSTIEFEGGEARVVLVLSNKKDGYYVVTAKACSCPSATYRPGQPCKHQRKYFAEQIAKPEAAKDEPLIERGGFKPFDELPSERAAELA